MKCYGSCVRKKKEIKTMNSKMTANSKLLITEPRKKKESKQLHQEQNHRNGDHREGYQWGGGGVSMVEKVQEIRSINGRHTIDRGSLRIVQEMEKPNYLYV